MSACPESAIVDQLIEAGGTTEVPFVRPQSPAVGGTEDGRRVRRARTRALEVGH